MTDARPTRATLEGRVYLDLQNLARRTRRNTQELLCLYALEGFLARLAASPYADRLVLKGGVLLAAYDTRRPTRDVDFQARQMPNEMAKLLAMVRDIASVALDDGLWFDIASAEASVIREDHTYSGTRVRLAGRLASAKVMIGVDINVGDPIWPSPRPIVLPGLLNREITLVGYPLSMVHAEKIVTMLDRGLVNTRWRDFADVYALSDRHSVRAEELRASFEKVGDHRDVKLVSLAQALDDLPGLARSAWRSWRRREQTADVVPDDLAEVLEAVARFADPVLTGEVTQGVWDPAERVWGE